jgi:putative nucleotidyltransferase with HDIG domain
MATKRISIDQIRLGMYVTGIDLPWIQTPFLTHRFLLRKSTQIAKLREANIRFVDIDTDRGVDAENTPEETLPETPEPTTPDLPDAYHILEARIEQMPESVRAKPLSEELHDVREAKEEMMGEVREMLDSVRTSGVVNGSQAKEISEEIIEATVGHEEAYAALIRTREFSPALYDHALSVSTLAVLLGRILGFEREQLNHLAMGALLHDIGLLQLPANLMNPVRSLSSSDRSLFESHPKIGVDILKNSKQIPEEVMRLVSEHHVISQSSSKSDTKTGIDFSHACKLIQVVDRYDEFLSGQGQPPPLPVKDALRELYQLGQKNELDQQLVSHLVSQIGIYPLYSLVQLNSGERGIVTAVTPGQLLHPVVLVIQDPNRQPDPEPMPINFSSLDNQGSALEIVNVLDAEKEGVRVEEILSNWATL